MQVSFNASTRDQEVDPMGFTSLECQLSGDRSSAPDWNLFTSDCVSTHELIYCREDHLHWQTVGLKFLASVPPRHATG